MTGKKKKTAGESIGGICNLLAILIVLVIIVVCLPISLPRVFGYEIYNVVSASMEPELSVGSAVYSKAVDPETLAEGDVIVFYGSSESNEVTTHRVVSNDTEKRELETKGDANGDSDFYPVSYDLVVGRVVLDIPYLGGIAAMLSTAQGKIYGAEILALAVLLKIASIILGRRKKNKPQ